MKSNVSDLERTLRGTPPTGRGGVRAQHASIYTASGHVRIPLRDVLRIWNLRAEYSHDAIAFISTKTNKVMEVFPRNEQNTDAWSCLRSRGLLHREIFESRAKQYFKQHPKPRRRPGK